MMDVMDVITQELADLRDEVSECVRRATTRGTETWIGIPSFEDGMIVRLWPSSADAAGPSVDIYVCQRGPNLTWLPVHEFPLLATDLDILYPQDTLQEDEDELDYAYSWVICTAMGGELDSSRAADAILLEKLTPDAASAVRTFLNSLLGGNGLWTRVIGAVCPSGVAEEMVHVSPSDISEGLKRYEQGAPTLDDPSFGGKREYIVRGAAAPSTDPRQEARRMLQELTAAAPQLRSHSH